MSRTVLTTMPGSAPYRRLQVSLEQDGDGKLLICLAEQDYAEGIGWFTQRSLALDPRQWARLQAALGSAEAREAIVPAAEERPATLPFPGPKPPHRFRLAAGDGSE
ncbi:hypothetical protein [Tautonia sociabilis]|uniref:Uncharacterized protein n=1 Tax=Tautonia sociabilis TaxID=2080755 RepID=A0A432MP80_9BACT|nr:hypothetical protein [Tautonia sociabilis]RUL88916.1 hypothetical protein TsocGM_04785 [Tautonia sociabilis]